MSNYLAIATVTEALRQLVEAGVDPDLNGAKASFLRPSDPANAAGGPRISIFLYRVTPSAALRNDDLLTRRAGGQLQERPVVALDLHYLLSFFGDDAQLEPQRLLGATVRTLHGRPVLTRQMLTDVLASTALDLATSNLVDQIDLVKLTPASLTLQDLSNLWSVFFQTQYVLSVAYEASVVLIEDKQTAVAALPVQRRDLRVLPFRQPLIESVRSAAGPGAPILEGDTLLIRGQRLQGDVTRVRIGGEVVTPPSVSDQEISLPLTSPPLLPGALRAGIQGVQVVQQLLFDTPADPHRGFESNVAPFVLQPRVTNPVRVGGDVRVDVAPPVRAGQRVSLLLNQNVALPGQATAYAFAAPIPTVDAATVQVTTSGVEPGQYFVRLQVDGAQSPLDLDTTSAGFGPTVTFA